MAQAPDPTPTDGAASPDPASQDGQSQTVPASHDNYRRLLSKKNLAKARKFLAALAGVAALAISQGLIEGTAAKWTALGISLLTALGVYAVKNASTNAEQS